MKHDLSLHPSAITPAATQLDSAHVEALIAFGAALSQAFRGTQSFDAILVLLRRFTQARCAILMRNTPEGLLVVAASGNSRERDRLDVLDLLAGDASDSALAAQGIHLLGRSSGAADYIVLPDAPEAALDGLLTALRLYWADRSPGVIRAALDGRHTGNPLSPDNPCGLTPAERAVTVLVAKGLRPAEVANRLGSALPTIRTHLRGIYTKTSSSGLIDLVRLLQHPRSENVNLH